MINPEMPGRMRNDTAKQTTGKVSLQSQSAVENSARLSQKSHTVKTRSYGWSWPHRISPCAGGSGDQLRQGECSVSKRQSGSGEGIIVTSGT